jgi:hypothetical protein
MGISIPFIGGAYAGRSLNINAQVCQNLYPVLDQEGGKSVVALMNTPGLEFFSDPSLGFKRKRKLGYISFAGTVAGVKT